MRIQFTLFFIVLFVVAAWSARAQERYEGNWQMTSMSLKVTIDSWGDHCGPRPKSSSRKGSTPVRISVRGKHLYFSKGNLSTEACNSLNPRVRSFVEKTTSSTWERTCRTGRNDPKFEEATYILNAFNDDKLVYKSNSKFKWTLKGSACNFRLSEKRTYERNISDNSGSAPPPTPTPNESVDSDVDSSACSEHGTLNKLTIHPNRVQLGPGQRACFKATGVDENGCEFEVSPIWSVTQNEQDVYGLLNKKGCFNAGQTAADSEGLYVVSARSGGKSDWAQVLVVFPDLADLLAARLRPLDDLEGSDSQQADTTAPAKTKTMGRPGQDLETVAPSTGARSKTSLIIVIVLIVVAMGVAIILVVIILRRSTSKENEEDFSNWPDAPDGSENDVDSAGFGDESGYYCNVCPVCDAYFSSDSEFCPHDRSKLVSVTKRESQIQEHGLKLGMVCPKCHRGYDPDARFCPHDAQRLLRYDEWKNRKS